MSDAQERAIGLGSLWFGFIGGAVAWTAQLLGGYFVVTLGCTTNTDLTLAVHLISLVALLVSWRHWRAMGTEEEPGVRTARQRSGFMARFGLFADALFGVLILFTGVTAFVLPRCAT